MSIQFNFSGKYAVKAQELANDAINYFDCTEAQAKRFAISFMADYGQGISKMEDPSLKVSKANKDGEVTMTTVEKCITKGKATPALSIARIVMQANTLLKEGVRYNCTSIGLVERLEEWLRVEPTKPIEKPVETAKEA